MHTVRVGSSQPVVLPFFFTFVALNPKLWRRGGWILALSIFQGSGQGKEGAPYSLPPVHGP
jgi:hypothetical protein